MPEREYYDYGDWMFGGGDPTYGQGASPTQDIFGTPAPSSPSPFTSEYPQPPAGPPPPGTQWMLNPTTRQYEAIGIGQMPPWGAISSQPGTPAPPASSTLPVGGGDLAFDSGRSYFGPSPQLRSLDSLWPSFNAPSMQAPPPFAYRDFSAPTLQDAENEPGYAFAATQGRKGVEASKAAQGIYRSGQTLKDIYAWASEFAKQNYSGVFDRSLRTYDTNRDNAADTYMTNYGVSRDIFDRNYRGYLDGHNSLRQKAQLDFGRDWDVYAKDIDNKQFLAREGND